ncbi:MAG: hypothetical protein E7125_07635 [Bacteroidales bacterium]|jgi:hypothetical protein|nr:hypothetical protein [Bacteroidales bacterium]
MERIAAKGILGDAFLGADELCPLLNELGFSATQEEMIPYDAATLQKAAVEGFILVWCPSSVEGTPITLRFLRDHFGIDPDVIEPCFYNQDWYLAEAFLDEPLDGTWNLIKKSVTQESRAQQPTDLIKAGYAFPSAILCAWTFFAWYYARKEFLWWHDFVWCNDTDHNGDRVYVGKYHDIDGVNKNGFSIHRHLSLRSCYGAVTCL